MTSQATHTDVDLLIHARWIVPVNARQDVLDNHCLAIRDGLIVDILPSAQADQRYQAARQQHLPDHVLIPGLVNTHGHAAMSLFRGSADDLPLMTWLQEHIWPMEARWISEEFVYHGTQLAIAEMLRGGTTCFADMYFFPEASARAATEAGMRVQLAAPIIDFPTPWAPDAMTAVNKTTRLHDDWRHSDLVSTAFGPHAPYSVSDEPLRRIATLAEQLDIPIHMHVHETAGEVTDALNSDGRRPLRRLYDLNLLSPRLLCVHATAIDDDDLALLKETGAHVVHCPESNLKLASGFCEVHRLQQHGINVALGTDGAASNNDLDMIAEMRTAAMLAKAVAGQASALPAYDALAMATINGARAMGLDQQIGSLEAGKRADVVAINFNQFNTMPVYHAVSQLVYSTQSSQVSHVWINGQMVLDQGELTTINRRKLTEHIQLWQTRLQENS